MDYDYASSDEQRLVEEEGEEGGESNGDNDSVVSPAYAVAGYAGATTAAAAARGPDCPGGKPEETPELLAVSSREDYSSADARGDGSLPPGNNVGRTAPPAGVWGSKSGQPA